MYNGPMNVVVTRPFFTIFTIFFIMITHFGLFSPPVSRAQGIEICGRIATINRQELLVDINSTQKGEGLRYYLEKDPLAKLYLDRYQEGTKNNWQKAVLGTVGTGFILGSIFTHTNDANPEAYRRQKKKKNQLLVLGASLIAINLLAIQAWEKTNEGLLQRAVQEYNKRNLPQIYFNPWPTSSRLHRQKKGRIPSHNFVVYMDKTWEF